MEMVTSPVVLALLATMALDTIQQTEGVLVCIYIIGLNNSNINYKTLDIDECSQNLCDPHVNCTNSPGSYSCGPCPSGYIVTDQGACIGMLKLVWRSKLELTFLPFRY